jgi:hypothetical protein
MTLRRYSTVWLRNSLLGASVAAIVTVAPWGSGPDGGAFAQTPPTVSLGAADPAAPLALTPVERTAILNAVRQEKPASVNKPSDTSVSVGAQLPASIALNILPDAALAQAPSAKTVQYTLIQNQVVLVDPTNMRVVDIISQ